MAAKAEAYLSEVLEAFDFGAVVVGAVRFGQGHINDTFVVHTQPENECCRRFILQRMSSAAFKRPDQLMENIIGVTEYLGREVEKTGGSREREAMRVIRPRSGEPYYTDSDGGAWRVYPFVEDTVCYQSAETPELFAASGRAFGRFQRLLQGYPAQTLHETIPHFHDTEDRLAKLKAAVAADKLGRAAECRAEIDFMMAREKDCSAALQALRDGILPLRVTHNDTKLNNVLMDKTTGNPFKVGGKEITAETVFTPEKADGETVVKFTFDASSITQATEIVVFETLYQGEVKIAAHEDINDEGQTVKIVPVSPGKPTTPNPGNPQTGDRSIMGFWIGLGAIALGGLAAGIIMYNRKKKEDGER